MAEESWLEEHVDDDLASGLSEKRVIKRPAQFDDCDSKPKKEVMLIQCINTV